ncbi:AraC-type DNA-binding protein [Burkholderia sp. CF099]|nr:AraC-type DNA-binding protein [Burkholderia sp. CF099]
MTEFSSAHTLPYSVQVLDHSEPFTNSGAFEGWDLEYTQFSAGRYECHSQEVRLEGVQLYTEDGNATMHQRGAAWNNSYVFVIPCQMRQSGRMDGRQWYGNIAAFRGEHEFDVLVPPMKLLVASISRDLFSNYLSTVEHIDASDCLKRGMQTVENPTWQSQHGRALESLVDRCCEHPEMLAYAQTRTVITHALMESLTPLMLDTAALDIASHRKLQPTEIVRWARDFVMAHIEQPLQIIDVCRALGVSRRALQYGFQDVLNVSPVTYLRLVRLNRARRDLVNASGALQVKDVAARWGFWHLSRFSAEYKQMFNELPSETLRRSTKSILL